MATVAVYDITNKQVGDIELNDNIFGVEMNAGLLHQAVVMQLAAQRLGTHATKTKQVVKMMSDFSVEKKALLITADEAENVEKSARNIPGVKAISTMGLNVHDILNHDKLFITKDAVTRIEEVFA